MFDSIACLYVEAFGVLLTATAIGRTPCQPPVAARISCTRGVEAVDLWPRGVSRQSL